MQLTFLQGHEPYTKKYEKRPDGTYKGSSYPNVFQVTSHVENPTSLAQFADCLKSHANIGHCLLTNNLDKSLVNESRAKHQRKDELRSWVVLDVDGLEGVDTAEQFIQEYLPEPFHNVSHIVQYSPSHLIKPGLRCHIYFMLYDELPADSVTSWLTWHNITHDKLSNQVTLSNSSMALSYPLDRVASANGRIIYIAPPECVGFDDPVTQRIELVEKEHEKLSFGFFAPSPAEIRSKVRGKVIELRSARGLPTRTQKDYTTVRADGTEILKDDLVEQGRITSWEVDNDRFMRCNINGGDSFAYYYHRDQEDPYLHNFKGEPSIRLRKLDPVFYRDQVVPHFEELAKTFPRPFVFRDILTDKWYMGTRAGEVIQTQPNVVGSEKKINDYFSEFGTSPPAIIPSWERIFDPTSKTQWMADEKKFNTWRPTEYQLNTLYTSSVPPTIEKVIRHVTGNDEETYDQFINWLAHIVQCRTKTGTAWVLHGVPGTGKGLLFHYILTPLMGRDYCHVKQIKDLKDRFNGWMEQCILCNIDEANAEDLSYEGKEVVNSLKNWITEPVITVRHMQTTPLNRPSFINFVFTTNDFGILPIQEGDRRFNVAPRQLSPLSITEAEVERLETEISQFASYLSYYKVDHTRVIKPLENAAKEDLKKAARTSIEEFFHACQTGDLMFFVEGLDEESSEYSSVATFKNAIPRWIEDAKNDRPSLIPVAELKAAHIVMCRDKGMKSGAFKAMAAKKGFPYGRPRDGDDRVYGWKIEWQLSDADKVELGHHLKLVEKTPAELEEKIKSEISSDAD